MLSEEVRKIAERICAQVSLADMIKVGEITYSSHSGEGFKNGLYFVYDKSKNVIYIGMISNGKRTSLYDRFKGHGSGCHKHSTWYNQACTVRFCHFKDLNAKQLRLAERVAIFAKLPVGNDGNTSEAKILSMLGGSFLK